MLNFFIRKVELKNGESRYRTVLTNSGKEIKSKTFRRKQDALTWGTRSVLEFQEHAVFAPAQSPSTDDWPTSTCQGGLVKIMTVLALFNGGPISLVKPF